jgi:hypothetical protein
MRQRTSDPAWQQRARPGSTARSGTPRGKAVLWIAVSATSPPQRRQHASWCPPTLVSASLSASVARSHLLVWWWLAHCEVEGQLVRAAIGQVHPLAAVWAHQVSGTRTAANGLDDLLLLGRHLFTPQLCSISTRCAGWPSTITQTMVRELRVARMPPSLSDLEPASLRGGNDQERLPGLESEPQSTTPDS